MSFIVVTVSDWHCCNIDYHKSNTLDRNKQYISKNKVWSGTIFWKPFAVVRPTFPFPDCFLFRTVRLQRPGISLWLIARPKILSICLRGLIVVLFYRIHGLDVQCASWVQSNCLGPRGGHSVKKPLMSPLFATEKNVSWHKNIFLRAFI